MLYMVTFTINIPPMLAYIPYMNPMGIVPYLCNSLRMFHILAQTEAIFRTETEQHPFNLGPGCPVGFGSCPGTSASGRRTCGTG